MKKTSVLAIVAAAAMLAAPVYAQGTSSQPSSQPSSQSSSEPSSQPSSEPSSQPSSEPSSQMSSEPSSQPSSAVSSEPSSQPGGDDDDGLTFDIDVSLDLNFTFEQTVEFRRVIVETNVQPVEVDFDVTVGASVPATINLTPLPVTLVTLYPALKGFLFFLLPDGRIIVVNPTTLKIVLIIYAD